MNAQLRYPNVTKRTLVGNDGNDDLLEIQDDSQRSITSTEEYQRKKRVLRGCNIAAFVLHGVSFIVLLFLVVIYREGSLQTQLTTDFRVYDAGATGPPQAGPFSTVVKSLGFYQIAWVELSFPLITCIFHAIIAFFPRVNKRYAYDAIVKEKNWIRWVEYSISASPMTWVIMQVVGVTNIMTLVVVGIIGNVALQYQGFLMEDLNTPDEVKRRKGKVDWNPTIVGWIIFMGQWLIILTYFFSAVGSPRPPGSEGVPLFVWFIGVGLFFQFAAFGFIQLLHYLRWPVFLATGYGYEIAMVALSFVSKFFLDFTLQIGIIVNQMST